MAWKRCISGIDWLTCTLREPSSPSAKARWVDAITSTQRALCLVDEQKPWAWQGYIGWAVTGLSWGNRRDGSIIRATGGTAGLVFQKIPLAEVNVSRIDLCVTLWPDEDMESYGRLQCIGAIAERDKLPESRRRKVTLILGNGDGDTLYVGSRKSTQYGRLYDKGRESGAETYQWAWRWEVEYHDQHANQIARQIQSSPQQAAKIAATVKAWWRARGVDCPCEPSTTDVASIDNIRRTATDSQTLAWLAIQVRPAIERLRKSVEWQEIARALFGDDEV